MRLLSRNNDCRNDLATKVAMPAAETAVSPNVEGSSVSSVSSGDVGEIGETRLTPQEAAETIASLERERLAQEQHAAGTISINEVIEQFGLSATPEKVLAALSENRRLQQQAQQQAPSLKTRIRGKYGDGRSRVLARIALAAIMAFVVCVLVVWMRLRTEQAAAKAGAVAFAAATAAANEPAVVAPQPAPPTPAPPPKPFAALVDALVVIDKSSGQPVSRLMSEVPDGRSVQVQDDTMEATLSLHQTDSFTGGTRTGWWTARKEHGRLFLKGFLPLRVSPGVAAQGNVIVANHSHRPNDMVIGPAPTPVWVPADRIRSIDSTYGTDAGVKEGDNSSTTYASNGEDWSRITMDALKPGDLQYDAADAKP